MTSSKQKQQDNELAELLDEPQPWGDPGKGKPRNDRPEMCTLVLAWVATGKSVRSFCKRPGMPCMRSIYNWLADDIVFAEEFSRAKAIGYDALAQECLDIADNGNEFNVRHRKLRIWTRLQLLARWDTARYGDKIQLGGEVKVSNDDTIKAVMALLATAKQRQLRDPKNRLRELMN